MIYWAGSIVQQCWLTRLILPRLHALDVWIYRRRREAHLSQYAIKDFDVLHLRDQAREIFINAVLNPPAPNEAARAAAERYKKHMSPRGRVSRPR